MPVTSSTPSPNVFSTLDASLIAQLGTQVPYEIITAPIKGTMVPFRDRLSANRMQNNQKAAIYSRISSLTLISGVTNSTYAFFQEGGTPNASTYTETQLAVVKKSFGTSLGASFASMLAANTPYSVQRLDNQPVPTLEEKLARLLHIQFVEAEETALILGNLTTSAVGICAAGNAYNYDGLDATLENADSGGDIVIDAGGIATTQSFMVQKIAEMTSLGIHPTAVLTNPQIAYGLKVAFANYNSQGTPYNPVTANTIPSAIGDLPVLQSKYIPLTASGTGYVTAPIYILTETHRGQPILYIEDQIPETMLTPEQMRQAGFATSMNYGVYAHSVFVNAAPNFQRKITGLLFSYTGTPTTAPSIIYS